MLRISPLGPLALYLIWRLVEYRTNCRFHIFFIAHYCP
jgi:hypothetical protein